MTAEKQHAQVYEEIKKWEHGELPLNNDIRKKATLMYIPLVRYVAERIASRLPPQVELDDLINAGAIGLLDAVGKFDPSKGVKFKTYAELRIRGSILDELRSMDWVPRTLRHKMRKLEEAFRQVEKTLGRPAKDEEVAQYMGISMEKFYKLLDSTVSIPLFSLEEIQFTINGNGITMLDFLTDESFEDPITHCGLIELRDHLAEAIDKLPEKEKHVVSLYYYDELTMKEIGVILGVSESRVCQLHSKVMIHLRAQLKTQEHDKNGYTC